MRCLQTIFRANEDSRRHVRGLPGALSGFAKAWVARSSAALGTLVLVGCATGVPSDPQPDGTETLSATAFVSPLPAPSPSASSAPRYEEVEFGAEGGPSLRGRVWSEGRIGVLLAHGFSQGSAQDDWDASLSGNLSFAEDVAGLGYGVLTFDFRGFCDRDGCSEGSIELAENWRDIAPAVELLRSRGSERIFLIGASMGGIATFRAADEAEIDLAGIVSLATPQFPSIYYEGEPPENDVTPQRLQRIEAPKLFVAGASDLQLPAEAPLRPGVKSVSFAEDARSMFEASGEPSRLEIVDSDAHGSALLVIAVHDGAAHTRELIIAFIDEHG